jgi:hypothetical protein
VQVEFKSYPFFVNFFNEIGFLFVNYFKEILFLYKKLFQLNINPFLGCSFASMGAVGATLILGFSNEYLQNKGLKSQFKTSVQNSLGYPSYWLVFI